MKLSAAPGAARLEGRAQRASACCGCASRSPSPGWPRSPASPRRSTARSPPTAASCSAATCCCRSPSARRAATSGPRSNALGRSSKSVTTRGHAGRAPTAAAMLAELTGVDAAWPLAGKARIGAGGQRPAGRRDRDRPRDRRAAWPAARRPGAASAGRPIGCRRSSTRCRASRGFALAPPAVMDEAGPGQRAG